MYGRPGATLAIFGKGHELHNDAQGSPAEIGAYEQALSIEYSYFQPTILGLAYEIMFKKWVISVIVLFFRIFTKVNTICSTSLRFLGQGDPEPAIVARHRSTLTDTLDYYEKILGTRKHLAKEVREIHSGKTPPISQEVLRVLTPYLVRNSLWLTSTIYHGSRT